MLSSSSPPVDALPDLWPLVIVGFTAIAAWTDWRSGRIYNALTLPGMLIGVAGRTWLEGSPGGADALGGWFAVGGLMVVALALFPHVGGGDVKLMAMLGAMLGLERGLEALLWTCTVAVVQVLAILTWKAGAWNACRAIWVSLTRRGPSPTVESGKAEDRADPISSMLTDRMRMAPAALVAVVIVLATSWPDAR
jgi:prepilin peptidase CpaA